MICPKCNGDKPIKSGIIKTRQRYKCKNCNYNYTVALKSSAKPKSMKKVALQLYLEGLGFRSIGRCLGVSNVSILKWIRSFGEQVEELHKESQEIKVVELDEMHRLYRSKKNFCWIWIAVDRYGKQFINFTVGDRSTATGRQLWG